MKNLIYLLIGLLSLPAYAQVVAIQNDMGRSLYLCINNDLKVAVEGCNSKDIILTTDNGKIKADEYQHPGYYIINPVRTGRAVVYVKRKTPKGIKTVDSEYFYVKKIPLTKPWLGGKPGGEMAKSLMCAQIAPSAMIECCGFDARFLITGFTVVVYRHKRAIFRRRNVSQDGARIGLLTNNFFYTLKNRDRVVFTSIQIKDCDGTTRLLDPMEFVITDAKKYRTSAPDDGLIIIDPITGTEVKRSTAFPK